MQNKLNETNDIHIVDDYYLQGILAQLKQRLWWKQLRFDQRAIRKSGSDDKELVIKLIIFIKRRLQAFFYCLSSWKGCTPFWSYCLSRFMLFHNFFNLSSAALCSFNLWYIKNLLREVFILFFPRYILGIGKYFTNCLSLLFCYSFII